MTVLESIKAGVIPRFRVKGVKEPPYIVDKSRLRRFAERDTIFSRVTWDTSWEGYELMFNEKTSRLAESGKEGYTRVDFALAYASWVVHNSFAGGFSWSKIQPFRKPRVLIEIDWQKSKHPIDETAKMSAIIKCAARFFGASLVGICRLNRDWLYAEVNLPEKFKNAIVMAFEMNPVGIATSPAATASAATGLGYSKMAFILACMGEFIRNLGYDAIQCGNDTALSIPLAIDAGLGELGRNGLLITPQYGPRVRLCKIFTDLPLEPDKPIEFGVRKVCRKCKLCAEHCEAEAISMDDEPSFEAACPSNNTGALKWYVNSERCYLFWCENGTDCSTCIKVCPYNIISSQKAKLSPKEFWKSRNGC